MIIPDNLRRCVFFIGYINDNGFQWVGTVFLIGVPVPGSKAYTPFMVTARHVVDGLRAKCPDGTCYLRVNTQNGGFGCPRMYLDDWRFHPTDRKIDIAMAPFPDMGIPLDHLTLPPNVFLERRHMDAVVGLGADVFLVGLFFNHIGKKRNTPIVRFGNIAAMPEEPVTSAIGEIEAYLVEARSIGGLSGSPVFAPRRQQTLRGQDVSILAGVNQEFVLIGLMHGHWKYQVDPSEVIVSDTGQKEAVNMGISIVIPSFHILEVLNDPDIQQHISRGQRAAASKP